MKCFLLLLTGILIYISSVAQYKVFTITNYGAVGDGKTVATKAVQLAVDDCNANGGGEVAVPPGIFIIGTLHLKSNVHLYLQSGAILRGSPNLNDYEIYISPKPFNPVHKGMLFTEDAENITISGEGQIDGNGDLFFDLDKAKTIDSNGKKFTRQKE